MGRLRGVLWLVAGLVVAVVAGAVAYIALSRPLREQAAGEEAAGVRVDVVVATQAVDVRTQLTAGDLELRQMPVELVPESAIRAVDQALGQITLVDLIPGEIILADRLLDPNVVAADGRLALVVVDDQVLMAFPASDLMGQVDVLKAGDHVDILYSLQFPVERAMLGVPAEGEEGGQAQQQEEQVTFSLLENVSVAAVVGGAATPDDDGAPWAILFTISPQDALLLKYAKDAGGTADIVLRAPGVEEPFTTEPVDVDYLINRYQIPVEVGR